VEKEMNSRMNAVLIREAILMLSGCNGVSQELTKFAAFSLNQ
jgi:starvation-inducible outer membrane lipoprotein